MIWGNNKSGYFDKEWLGVVVPHCLIFQGSNFI